MRGFKTLSPIEAQRSLAHRAIVCLPADWHGCELREGLRGLCWGRGCLSDCLRTKHLLWPVIKALGNNRHDIHLDKHTFTRQSWVCMRAWMYIHLLSLAVVGTHGKKKKKKSSKKPFLFKHSPTIIDKTVLKLRSACSCAAPQVFPQGPAVVLDWESVLWLSLPWGGRGRPIEI